VVASDPIGGLHGVGCRRRGYGFVAIALQDASRDYHGCNSRTDHFRDPKPYWPRWLNRFRKRKPVTFYRKELNEQVAQHLTMKDMAGTDLATIIEAIKQQAKKARSLTFCAKN